MSAWEPIERGEDFISGLNKALADAFDDLGHNDHNMDRSRPYRGQPHTDTGTRGATEIRGITFRDLRDAFIRAVCLSGHHVVPHLYEEADKGEAAALCEADLYGWNLDALDPMAIAQNLCCEVERLMGIFPNIEPLVDLDPQP